MSHQSPLPPTPRDEDGIPSAVNADGECLRHKNDPYGDPACPHCYPEPQEEEE